MKTGNVKKTYLNRNDLITIYRRSSKRWLGIGRYVSLSMALMACSVSSNAATKTEINSVIKQLEADAGSRIEVSIHPATGAARFIQFGTKAFPYSVKKTSNQIQMGQLQSIEFFKKYGTAFGLVDPYSELSLVESNLEKKGTSFFKFEQKYQGLNVFAGQLRTHFNEDQKLVAINGTFIPEINVATEPTLSLSEAIAKGRQSVVSKQKNHLFSKGSIDSLSSLAVEASELLIYRTGLFQGIPGKNHLAYAVTFFNGAEIHEQVMVDAMNGEILDSIPLVFNDLYRKLFEVNLETKVWEEGDKFPGALNSDQELVVATNEVAYGFFKSTFGRDSYDGIGAKLLTINNDPRIQCPNANWNGATTNYCKGVIADDVVAHEWGHAYTEFTDNLVYLWQPGALNESYSDIWGEVVDQLNKTSTDHDTNRADGMCYGTEDDGIVPSNKWLMGEDTTAFGGALRDMWAPACKRYPGKVSDKTYKCGESDGGGVHSNSSVPNHGFALLSDGGKYNGVTIRGIGLTKAASIYWRAQTVYQTRDTDFAAHAEALESSCNDLVGAELPELVLSGSPMVSKEVIDPSDCMSVHDMTLAVELRKPPVQCNFKPLLAQTPSDLCAGSDGKPASFFEDDFETGMGAWTVSHESPNPDWPLNSWEISSKAPGHKGNVLYAVDPIGGECGGKMDASGIMRVESPEMVVPDSDSKSIRLAFDHYVATEMEYDGGTIEYSVNGGTYARIESSYFLYNAYNKKLAIKENTNPLAGQYAFTGTDQGSTHGTWGQSQIDLGFLSLRPGDKVRIRFNIGTDGCGGVDGWYVDNVKAYACAL